MKFKLIKEYPSSPALGVVIEKLHENKYVVSNPNVRQGIIFNPESYPEFWQQVEDEKKDVLSTDDGAELKKGEKYHLVSKHSFKIHEAIYDGNKPDEENWNTYKRLVAAEMYAARNKPCFSYREIFESLAKKCNVPIDAVAEMYKIAESRI